MGTGFGERPVQQVLVFSLFFLSIDNNEKMIASVTDLVSKCVLGELLSDLLSELPSQLGTP